MRNAVTLAIATLLFASGARADAQTVIEGSRAFTFTENDNKLIELQNRGGDPSRPGNVKIEYYGHDAFKVTSPEGVTMLIDPWRNDPSGTWGKWFLHEFPEIPVDIAVSTHAHFDHDAVNRPHALMVLERLVGDFTLADMHITGLAGKHQCHSEGEIMWDQIAKEYDLQFCPPNNPLSFDNDIEIVQTGGLRIADWGDNTPTPSPEVQKQLMNVDVLILPIDDSEHILTYKEADEIISKYHPKAVIPGHYQTIGVDSVLSGLKTADGWVQTQRDVHRVGSAELDLSPADLNGAHGRIYYFGSDHRSN